MGEGFFAMIEISEPGVAAYPHSDLCRYFQEHGKYKVPGNYRCEPSREIDAVVYGRRYIVRYPQCQEGMPGQSPLRDMASALERASGYDISSERWCNGVIDCWALKPFVAPADIMNKVRPCLGFHGRPYYLTREIKRAILPFVLRCKACRKHLRNERLRDRFGDYCSGRCFSPTLYEHIKEERQCRTLRVCKRQLKALRKFLKSNNQEVFQSLPAGFEPLKTSHQ